MPRRNGKNKDTIMVFTFKGVEHLLHDGGTSRWRLNLRTASKCQWVVCVRNNETRGKAEGPEPHRTAFMAGEISGFRLCPPEPDDKGQRYLIELSRYALINIPDLWDRKRWPVRYTTLADLGIDPEKLDWKPMPQRVSEPVDVSVATAATKTNSDIRALTMAEAKQGLALMFNVAPDAIEITIRG